MMAALMALVGCGSSGEQSSSASNVDTGQIEVEHLDEPSVVIHYHRNDNNYEGWNLWLWGFGYDGVAYEFNGTSDYGVYAHYPLSNWVGSTMVGFIVRTDEWAKDPSPDRFINLDEWEPNEYDEYHAYLKTADVKVYTDTLGTVYNGIAGTYFMNKDLISVTTTTAPYQVEVLAGDEVALTWPSTEIKGRTTFTINTSTMDINFETRYRIRVSFVENDPLPRVANVLMHRLFSAEEFGTAYNYDGELGALYTPTATTFKVWAPTSSAMFLRLYDNGTPVALSATLGNDTFTAYEMTKGAQGVWSYTVNGDLDGKYYTYYVTNTAGTHEVVDPYAKAAGVNGVRGMIIDFDRTDPEGWDEVNDTSTYASNVDASVYELHVRDLTMDDTWTGTAANRGLFAGMWESGTTYTEGATTVTTGFDHIKELGVNAVHVLPMFDHSNNEIDPSFNWGYNPLNYNVIEGSYSSNPYDGAIRIQEAKEMIQAYDEAGIKIIMDVVYNHVSDANSSNFNLLVPGYFFRYGNDGAYSSGSGCGNDTASERYMFKKFMVDSASFLAEEYKLGGFRYDLMGLHTTDAMKAVRDSIVSFDPDFLIYGEPWVLGTSVYGTPTLATNDNLFKTNMTGIGGFSDQIRDAVRGGVFNSSDAGWIQASNPSSSLANSLSKSLKGSYKTGTEPNRVVNYVSAHDNNTLFDKLLSSGVSEANAPKVSTQASTIVTFAQGIPFYHAGEELMRQKINPDGSYNHNSYASSDEINSLKWDDKVTYKAQFDKYKAMIALRDEHAIFRNYTSGQITSNFTALTSFGGYTFTSGTVGYKLIKGMGVTDAWTEAIVIHNGNIGNVTVNASGYTVAFASHGTLTASASMVIPGNVSVVLYK
jgi:pullulanase